MFGAARNLGVLVAELVGVHSQNLESVGGGWNKPGYIQTRTSALIVGYVCACTPRRDVAQSGGNNNPTQDERRNGLGLNNVEYYRHAAERAAAHDHGYDLDAWTPPPPTTPAVVLDPFGGTGTTAMVARALGRVGISLDMSADYCRLAQWRIHESDHDLKTIARTAGDTAAASVAAQRAAERAGQQSLL